MAAYQYLLWDIDGTVLNFEAAEKAALQQLFSRFGLGSCSDALVRQYSAINARYWQALECNQMTKPEILIGRFREFFSSIGIDEAIAAPFNDAYQLALGDTIVFCDNALSILQQQKQSHTLLAVTNGTIEAQTKKLRQSGLDRIFDHIFISDLIGVEKPNRAFFDVVFAEAGITDLSTALIIGDSLTSDIRGGINAGIDTCWYNPKRKPASPEIHATYCIYNLNELSDIV